MKKLGSILFITILLLLTVSGLFRGQVSAASTKSTIQILLEVKEKLYQIKVTILDESGEPIEGAKVTLYWDCRPISFIKENMIQFVYVSCPRQTNC